MYMKVSIFSIYRGSTLEVWIRSKEIWSRRRTRWKSKPRTEWWWPTSARCPCEFLECPYMYNVSKNNYNSLNSSGQLLSALPTLLLIGFILFGFMRTMGMRGGKGGRGLGGPSNMFGFGSSTARLINKDEIKVRFKYVIVHKLSFKYPFRFMSIFNWLGMYVGCTYVHMYIVC